jgi:hypothetical protein
VAQSADEQLKGIAYLAPAVHGSHVPLVGQRLRARGHHRERRIRADDDGSALGFGSDDGLAGAVQQGGQENSGADELSLGLHLHDFWFLTNRDWKGGFFKRPAGRQKSAME